MTLNGVISPRLLYCTEFDSFRAHYVKVVEDTYTDTFWGGNVAQKYSISAISLMAIFLQGTTPARALNWGTLLSLSKT